MKTRILKKLNSRVKLEEFGEGKYKVFRRVKKVDFLFRPSYTDWELAIQTSSIKKAFQMKHNLWLLLIRDLGYRPWLIERRKKRKKHNKSLTS